MKNISLSFLTTLLVALATVLTFSQCERDNVEPQHRKNMNHAYHQNKNQTQDESQKTQMNICDCLVEKFKAETLSNDEINAITFMLEEEKLARDVYLHLSEMYDYPIFSNIARAESRHMEVTKCLIERYDLENPVGDNGPGIFMNEQLSNLYTTLLDKGGESMTEAFKVGATIEDLDLADLYNWIEGGTIDNEDILAVFGELTRGSRNHLRAFTKVLDQFEESYSPQFLELERYTKILEGEPEHGGEICDREKICKTNQSGGKRQGSGSLANCTGTGQSNGNNNSNCMGNGGSSSCTGHDSPSGETNNNGSNGNHGNGKNGNGPGSGNGN